MDRAYISFIYFSNGKSQKWSILPQGVDFFISHFEVDFFLLFISKMLTLGWLFLTFFTYRNHEKVRWCLLQVTKSQKKSKNSSRKSQKYDMFFWHNLTSFAIFSKNEKKLQVQNFFNFYHRWHTVITRTHYSWS